MSQKMKQTEPETKGVPVRIDQVHEVEKQPIPAFFKMRAAGYFILGSLVLACSVIWSLTTSRQLGNSIVLIAAVMFLLTTGAGIHLLVTARAGRWFTMLLTCQRVEYVKLHQGLKGYFNPTSQTAFRQAQRVTFAAQDGTVIVFDFEAGRRFLPNARYDFYFHRPAEGEVTVDMLERLKIDHEIHPQPAPEN